MVNEQDTSREREVGVGDMGERAAWLFELPCTHRHATQERADMGCVQNTQPALLREVIKQAAFALLTIQGRVQYIMAERYGGGCWAA